MLCVLLTLSQLRRLYRDFTIKNLETVRVASLVTSMMNYEGDPVINLLKGQMINKIFRQVPPPLSW